MDFENCRHWWLFKTYNHNSREWFLLVLHFYSSFKNDLPIHISWLCSRPSSFQNVLCIFQNLNKSNKLEKKSRPQVLTMISAFLFWECAPYFSKLKSIKQIKNKFVKNEFPSTGPNYDLGSPLRRLRVVPCSLQQ